MKIENLGSPAERGVAEEQYLAERVTRVMPLDMRQGRPYKLRQRLPKPWGIFAMDSLVQLRELQKTATEFRIHLGYLSQDGELIGGIGGPGFVVSQGGVVLFSSSTSNEEQGYILDARDQADHELDAMLRSMQE